MEFYSENKDGSCGTLKRGGSRRAAAAELQSDDRREQRPAELVNLLSLLEFKQSTEREDILHTNQDLYLFYVNIFLGLNMLLCSHFGRRRGQP